MLYVWLIPGLIILAGVVLLFYIAICRRGGSGVRAEGFIVHDIPMEEDNPPP
jgi:hypothetical protein